jgi:hypothetical protein
VVGRTGTTAEALALADACYAQCQIVARFIDEKVRTAVDARAQSIPYGVDYQVQLLRAIAWLRSLIKLNDPGDFQAVATAARSLFEGAVDVTLMHFDPTENSPEKMDAWELSAKLKYAEAVTRYVSTMGQPPEEHEKTIMAFVQREQARVEQLRARWWPRKSGAAGHPPRWTGRDLGTDSERAEALHPSGFLEFYRLRYPQICWNTHGSGAAGIAGVAPEVFPMIGGMAYREAARFATVVAEVTTKAMGCWNKDEFSALRAEMKRASTLVYASHRGP